MEGEGSEGPVAARLPQLEWACLSTDGLSDIRLRLVELARRLLRGEFSCAAELFRDIPKGSPLFPAAIRYVFIGAIGGGDERLFERALEALRAYPLRNGSTYAKLAADLTEIWLRLFLNVSDGIPAWLVDLDLDAVPFAWRRSAVALARRFHDLCGDCRHAELLARAEFAFTEPRDPADGAASRVGAVLTMLALAAICRDSERTAEMIRWYARAVGEACSGGVLVPLLGASLGPCSEFDRLLGAESRDMLEKVRELSEPFFRNVIRFHNRLAESPVTEKLSMRLFYIVTQVKRGRGYREIGHSMGIAHGRARNLVFEAYKRLGVHKYTEIGKFVW